MLFGSRQLLLCAGCREIVLVVSETVFGYMYAFGLIHSLLSNHLNGKLSFLGNNYYCGGKRMPTSNWTWGWERRSAGAAAPCFAE